MEFKWDWTDEGLAIGLGKSVGSGKPMLCPVCSQDDPVQPMASFGDLENHLFCPHCDLGVRLEITYNPYKHKGRI